MDPSAILAQFGMISLMDKEAAKFVRSTKLGNNCTIDNSQNSQQQSMKICQIKRVRFNLESNRTIYFDKHARIKVGLSRMRTIKNNLCRWGDIDSTTETGFSSVVPRLPRKYNSDNLLSTLKKDGSFCTPRPPVRRRSAELTHGPITPRRPSRRRYNKNAMLGMLGHPASSSTNLKDAALHSYHKIKNNNSLQSPAAPPGILLQESRMKTVCVDNCFVARWS
jgi:hypothetical protein